MSRPTTRQRPKPRARQKSSRPAPATAPIERDDRFRVLIAVNRPRFRSRAERAAALPGWNVRSLLNREDPIGLINREAPHIFICSDEFGRSRNLAFCKAAQRFRGADMRIIALIEDPALADTAAELGDVVLSPPWRTEQLRAAAAQLYEEMRGTPPAMPAEDDDSDDDAGSD